MPSNLTLIRFEQGCHGIVIAACLFMYICTTWRLKARWLRGSLSKTADLKVWATNSHQHFFLVVVGRHGSSIPIGVLVCSVNSLYCGIADFDHTSLMCKWNEQTMIMSFHLHEVDDVLCHDENEGRRLLVRQSGRHVSLDTVQSSVLPDGCSCSDSVSGEFADR